MRHTKFTFTVRDRFELSNNDAVWRDFKTHDLWDCCPQLALCRVDRSVSIEQPHHIFSQTPLLLICSLVREVLINPRHSSARLTRHWRTAKGSPGPSCSVEYFGISSATFSYIIIEHALSEICTIVALKSSRILKLSRQLSVLFIHSFIDEKTKQNEKPSQKQLKHSHLHTIRLLPAFTTETNDKLCSPLPTPTANQTLSVLSAATVGHVTMYCYKIHRFIH